MACDLITNMEEIGFFLFHVGGGCGVMVKHADGRTIVASAEDGDLPSEGDFLVCVYDGDFTRDGEVRELDGWTLETVGEAPASGLSPIDEALRLAAERAALETASDRLFRHLNGHGPKPARADVLALIAEEERAERPCPDMLAELRRLLSNMED